MKKLILVSLAAASLVATSEAAMARGCIKGALVGGVAGHYMGHHGWLGAAAGCVIGRHQANKHDRDQLQNDRGRDYESNRYPGPYRNM